MTTIFFGSSDYCLPILTSLYKQFKLAAIITKPHSPVSDFAKKNKIPVFTPNNKSELANLSGMLISLNLDMAIVADYGLIIPKEIFEIPKYKTLNIHFSKLPQYRGPSPVQYTILNADQSAWISYMLMSEKMDTGDILLQEEFSLSGHETTGDLYQKLFEIAAQKLPEVIKIYVSGKIIPQKQAEGKATYTKLLTRDDGFIPFSILKAAISGEKVELKKEDFPESSVLYEKLLNCQIAKLLEKTLRAFSPWPGLYTNVTIQQCNPSTALRAGNETIKLSSQKRLKLIKLHLENNHLVINLVQLEGKNPVSWKQFLEGYSILH